jgi:hypothetical protein
MEDFETVQEVLDAYRAGVIDDNTANKYISDLIDPYGADIAYRDDTLRMQMVNSVLGTLNYYAEGRGVRSDDVARFAWDIAQQVMNLRAGNVPATNNGPAQAAAAAAAAAPAPTPFPVIDSDPFGEPDAPKAAEPDDGPF